MEVTGSWCFRPEGITLIMKASMILEPTAEPLTRWFLAYFLVAVV